MVMTNDEVLRRTAQLIRERADAASPEPWEAKSFGFDEDTESFFFDFGAGVGVASSRLGDAQADVEHIVGFKPSRARDLAVMFEWLAEHGTRGAQDAAAVFGRAYIGV